MKTLRNEVSQLDPHFEPPTPEDWQQCLNIEVTADVNWLLAQVKQLNKRLESVEHFLSPEELHNPFD